MQEGRTTTAGHGAKCRATIQVILADDIIVQQKMAQAEDRKNKYCEDMQNKTQATTTHPVTTEPMIYQEGGISSSGVSPNSMQDDTVASETMANLVRELMYNIENQRM